MTLRKLMTEEIVHYGWKDNAFRQTVGVDDKHSSEAYKEYLDRLADDDFLCTYNQMREIILNLS
jgi:hypothetical protein